ncbi:MULTISPECIES: RbsD/FucU family protein [Paracoccus]|jgi:L-fucose mutarotase|uniref:Ribose ABC transporter n=1 Tax=Paracoccus litorisediminis TaxID=2006130 RepID=A0A844HN69_9RHOB|nr:MULTISPECIES: RbsD/FucU domain-containing protein [Paracoccus]MBD9529340.1 ribose ABC transporter [Paracoccus sp. PAR01]MTH59102.1 ribose ABC transporter [Paracoccus litorisediminis]
MLKGIHSTISPELLYVMAQMGHGDELAIVDVNFPAASVARHLPYDKVLTIGLRLPQAVTVITNLMPLDTFVPAAATSMQVVDDPDAVPEAIAETIPIIERAGSALQSIDRFGFYEFARNSFAILQCHDTRLYANMILKKGVITANPARA